MEQVMSKRQIIATIVCIVALIGLLYQYSLLRGEADEFVGYLKGGYVPAALAVVPIIMLMYYAAGRIWHPYLKNDGLDTMTLMWVQLEIALVNMVVPFLNISGFVYALARLKSLGISEGKASGMYIFRYIISISTKWIEIAVAMAILIMTGKAGEMPGWVVWSVCGLILVIAAGFILGLMLVREKMQFPKRWLEHPKLGMQAVALQAQMNSCFRTIETAFSQESAFLEALRWGLVYSFLEILPFWVVACLMGHPELLLQIIVASGVAIAVGIIISTPMGIGGFDGAMILLMGSMGASIALALAIELLARFIILVATLLGGIVPWIEGMRYISRKSK